MSALCQKQTFMHRSQRAPHSLAMILRFDFEGHVPIAVYVGAATKSRSAARSRRFSSGINVLKLSHS